VLIKEFILEAICEDRDVTKQLLRAVAAAIEGDADREPALRALKQLHRDRALSTEEARELRDALYGDSSRGSDPVSTLHRALKRAGVA